MGRRRTDGSGTTLEVDSLDGHRVCRRGWYYSFLVRSRSYDEPFGCLPLGILDRIRCDGRSRPGSRGFVITAVVYIFKREEFHAVVKPAVLTAFLGYVAVIIGLLFDLGLPWNIWHLMIYWNHHSPLFEVGWCVMLYTTVLLLEFSPVPLEAASSWAKVRAFLIKYRMVFVLLGISLSTLHQSSLGSLFLIMPHKLHPLWYTPILPILFFISAVTLGLMMVSWESLFTSHVYRRKPEGHLVAKLLGAARWVILFYLLVRFGDLAVEKNLDISGRTISTRQCSG